MSGYDYEDAGVGRLQITGVGRDSEACIRIDDGDHIHLPAAERVKAAQALAGDGRDGPVIGLSAFQNGYVKRSATPHVPHAWSARDPNASRDPGLSRSSCT